MKVSSVFAIIAVASSVSARISFDGLDGIRLDSGVDTVSATVDQQSTTDAKSHVMESLREKLAAGSNQAMSQLTSVLMLKKSSTAVAGLRAKIDMFQMTLLLRLQDDLSELSERFGRNRSGPLSDDEKYQFSEMVQNKWGESLSSELSTFQQSALPKWVNSVRNVWKGLENQVMEKIRKFKIFMQKHVPSTAAVCRLSGSGSRTGLSSLDTVGNGRLGISKRFYGDMALLTVAVAAGIVLAIFAPYLFAVVGIVLAFDLATIYILEHIMDSEDTYDDDSTTFASEEDDDTDYDITYNDAPGNDTPASDVADNDAPGNDVTDNDVPGNDTPVNDINIVPDNQKSQNTV